MREERLEVSVTFDERARHALLAMPRNRAAPASLSGGNLTVNLTNS